MKVQRNLGEPSDKFQVENDRLKLDYNSETMQEQLCGWWIVGCSAFGKLLQKYRATK
jgi:hypothetical protein